MDEDTPQYNVVLENLESLTERLQHAKEVETLLQKFIMQKWIANKSTATANELVLLALNRIKNQVTDYDVFITMLKDMPGVKSIADQITSTYHVDCELNALARDNEKHFQLPPPQQPKEGVLILLTAIEKLTSSTQIVYWTVVLNQSSFHLYT